MNPEIIWFKDCSYDNKHLVGGKCSSLGELHQIAKKIGFSIGDGFALTIDMYDTFIEYNELTAQIETDLANINVDNIKELEEKSKNLRALIINGEFSEHHKTIITEYYNKLSHIYTVENIEVAVRSSALAEDFPNASCAGQHDTFFKTYEV